MVLFKRRFGLAFTTVFAFDTYNGNTPANSRPIAGSNAMESLCEDGSTAAITADFATLVPQGQDATLPGPNGPIAPGDIATMSFVLDGTNPAHQYFQLCVNGDTQQRLFVFPTATQRRMQYLTIRATLSLKAFLLLAPMS